MKPWVSASERHRRKAAKQARRRKRIEKRKAEREARDA